MGFKRLMRRRFVKKLYMSGYETGQQARNSDGQGAIMKQGYEDGYANKDPDFDALVEASFEELVDLDDDEGEDEYELDDDSDDDEDDDDEDEE